MMQHFGHRLTSSLIRYASVLLAVTFLLPGGAVHGQDETDANEPLTVMPQSPSAPEEDEYEDEDDYDTGDFEDAPAAIKDWEERDWPYVDTSHRVLSNALETAVKRIDVFFADNKVYRDATRSYVQITGDVIFREAGEIDFDGRVRAKIDLPKTKERLKFLIETDPEESVTIDGQTPAAPPAAVADPEAETNYFASVEGVFDEFRRWDIRPSLGINFSQPIDPFVRLRLRRNVDFSGWTFRFEQNFFWFDSVGTVSGTLFEFNHAINNQLLFRSSAAGTWRNETKQFELSQIFTLFQTLSERRALAYDVGVLGNDEPTVQASSYFASVRYRQNIHKKWLFVEAIPAVNLFKEENWEPNYSFILRLDLVFGSRYI